MPTAHLISGLPCSGKTTYATRLAADVNGVLFSLDRWLITLFGSYSIAAVGHDEHVRRVFACRELIWAVASEFLQRDTDVVFDDGFFLREHRMQRVTLATGVRARAMIHFLDVPLPVLRARLDARNARLPAFNFRIDPLTLDTFVSLLEVPSGDEGADLVVVPAGSLSAAG